MDVFTFMPTAVGVCTNVLPLVPLVHTDVDHVELAECFARARRSNAHTRPAAPPSAKEAKRLLARLDTFHSSHLNTFLYAYMYSRAGARIPEHVLRRVHFVCVNCDAEWVARCQNLAVHVLTAELQAKRAGVVPRRNDDEPIALAQLRPTLPVLRHVPEVSIGPCHFRFIGAFDDDDIDNDDNERRGVGHEPFCATVRVCNRGRHACVLDLPQTRTIIDGAEVANRFITTTLERQVLQAKESMELTLMMTHAPRAGFAEFQQLIVLAVDGGAVKFFLTFTVLAPRQGIFRQRFPGCLPLLVQHSPLERYAAPMMLQILKSVLVRQQGLSSASVVHLLARQAVHYKLQNVDVMQEAMRVMEIVKEQMNLMDVLDSYWRTQDDRKATRTTASSLLWSSSSRFGGSDGHRGGGRRRCRSPPVSSAQPAGYLPGVDLPSDHIGRKGILTTAAPRARDDRYFPSAATRLPEALTRAPPAVIMGIVLLWLAQMDIAVFDRSFVACDALVYLETSPPYLRGVLMWVIDLCCALLMNSSSNGATVRDLAMTFASVLVRGDVLAPDEASVDHVERVAVVDNSNNNNHNDEKQPHDENNDQQRDDRAHHNSGNDVSKDNSSDAATATREGGSDAVWPAHAATYDADATSDDGAGVTGNDRGVSFAAQVELRQCAVTALVTWITLYKTRYDQLYQ